MKSPSNRDFRLPTESKWTAPRAVVDAPGGLVIAMADVPANPGQHS